MVFSGLVMYVSVSGIYLIVMQRPSGAGLLPILGSTHVLPSPIIRLETCDSQSHAFVAVSPMKRAFC